MPNYQQLLDDQGDNEVQLDPWFKGKTRFGIAVPSYMDITAIPELNDTDADQFLGIEPSAVIMQRIPEEVVPTYGLKKSVEGSTEGMLSEVDNRYNNREDFAFIAWSPH
jgi:glycine betaine/proline transport system substrate-binding protein